MNGSLRKRAASAVVAVAMAATRYVPEKWNVEAREKFAEVDIW